MGFAREVEEVALPATSQSGPSAAVAAGPQPPGTSDADAENDADTSSVIFTEVGDSRASSQTLDKDAEEIDRPAVAERRMERQTSPVYRTGVTAERLEFWRQSTSIRGELTGNIGFLFGNVGQDAINTLGPRASVDAPQAPARADRVLGLGGRAG